MSNTSSLSVLLTNSSSEALTFVSSKVTGSSSTGSISLPKTVTRGTYGGLGVPASDTPYTVEWVYSPDGGATHLSFTTKLNGEDGIIIIPNESGPLAGSWQLGEHPERLGNGWLVRYYYNVV
ncbi:hypothetical protein PsWM33_02332 [Pseudovibrio sp. WM33]|nr:hypothetical protein PsWM33_02332 [Pseudovibrio sp. WM33]